MTTEAEVARVAPRLTTSTTTTPTTRRAMLMAAVGGIGGLVASALGRPAATNAAAGNSLIIGSQANNAGTGDTQLITNSSVIAFKLLQQGPGTALMGYATPTSGATRGVYGRTDSPNGYGLQARNNGAAGTGAAIQAIGGNNIAVDATTSGNERAVIRAAHAGIGDAIVAEASAGFALHAISSGTAVRAESSAYGTAIWGVGEDAPGVFGESGSAAAVFGQSITSFGVYGYTPSTSSGVRGNAPSGTGVFGSTGTGKGVYGEASSGYGVHGHSSTNAGVVGSSTSSYSGYFSGSLWAQSANAAVKAFRIDHPLDPANKVLVHSCVESNERKLVYDGTVTTGPSGEATIELPDYFDALNRDVRYQLTVIGSFAQAIVKREVADNSFTIATSEPRTRVCWQVSGVRRDAFATAHPLEVEGMKTGHEKGRYLTPREHGQPASAGVDAAMGT